MIEIIFWISVIVILYTYIGFPLLVFLRGRFFKKPFKSENITPKVTMIIVAHNEAKNIAKKLDNIYGIDYPQDCFDIVVASDGSEDGTDEIVLKYAEKHKNLKLLSFSRQGKIPILNMAVTHATGEILIFSDANSIYTPDAFRNLVRHFADPTIGGVAGNQCYIKDNQKNVADPGERTFWNFDQTLKQLESDAGSVISATGAIYAIRRELFEPVPSGVGDDAVISYRVIAKDYRMVYEQSAIAYEPVAASEVNEFYRKVRVCIRGLRGLLAEPRLFNPFKYGFYSVQLFSHKLLRWLMIWPLLFAFVTSIILSSRNSFFYLFTIIQILFYGIAIGVFLFRQNKFLNNKIFKVFTIPFFFCMTNVAFLVAQLQFIQGRRIDAWQVQRK